MAPLRAFIAVDLPSSIQQAIQKKINELRQYAGDSVRWVQAGKIHLTLKFLGDVLPADVEKLTEMLQTEAGSHPAFDVSIGGLGSFPNSKRPRVLFAGVQAGAGLEALQKDIESACSRLGYKTDRHPFTPHLTMGRIKDHASRESLQRIRRLLEETKIDSLGTVRVDSVNLYQSQLRPGGPLYTRLLTAPLRPVMINTAME